jgi:hypothetical protein
MSRDVQWLNLIYNDYMNNEDISIGAEMDQTIYDLSVKPRVSRELQNLHTFYNPMMDHISDLVLVGATESGFTEPQNFQQAWNHPEIQEQKCWQQAIKKEYKDMINKEVWKKVSLSSVPANRRLLGSKWVFKKKRNGDYRARLVALGYNQIPGVDYTANYSPVVHEVTMRTVLLLKLINNWPAELIDVETAFLYGKFEEEIYLKFPDGYAEVIGDNTSNECLVLRQALYGLVQAARQGGNVLSRYSRIWDSPRAKSIHVF